MVILSRLTFPIYIPGVHVHLSFINQSMGGGLMAISVNLYMHNMHTIICMCVYPFELIDEKLLLSG